jgi:ferredoxin
MKHFILYYFSGTGNTAHVCNLLRNAFEKQDVKTEMVKMEDIREPISPAALEGIDAVGLCFPVYAFRPAAIVLNFAELLPDVQAVPIFHIKTAGGVKGLTHYASYSLSKALAKKGYRMDYDRTVAMGSNWFYEYDTRLVKQLALAAEEKVSLIAEDILNGKKRILKPNFLQTFLSWLVSYGEHHAGAKQFGKSLSAGESCNACGLCAANCPQGNIRMNGARPVFGSDCLWCMRCIYACPKEAIYSKGMQFAILKNGYDLSRILGDDSIIPDFVNADTRGAYQAFFDYLQDKQA